jgi:hypothetical protein
MIYKFAGRMSGSEDLMTARRKTNTRIEIIEIPETLDQDHAWQVTWPEPEGSRGTFVSISCALAVQHALMVRLLIGIQQGRQCDVMVLDGHDGEAARATSLAVLAGKISP